MEKTIEKTKEYLEEVIEILNECENPQEKIQCVLEYGEDIIQIEEKNKTQENKVKGCVSDVFISSEIQDNRIYFKASSQALIIKGYLAILIEAFSGLKLEDFSEHSKELLEDFSKKANIKSSLSASRSNAFTNILNLMQNQAQSFLLKIN